jgi:hypothetical protein
MQSLKKKENIFDFPLFLLALPGQGGSLFHYGAATRY